MPSIAMTVFVASVFVASTSAQVVYRVLPKVDARIRHQMVSDGQGVLMTGGTQTTGLGGQPEMWAFANGAWSQIGALAHPNPLTDSAYDRARSRFVGIVDEGGFGMTMVEWDGATTSYVSTVPNSLYFCQQQQITFDAGRSACVVRGYEPTTATNELWQYDGVTWSQLSVASGPAWGAYRLLTGGGGDLLLVGQPWGGSGIETWRWNAGSWSLQPSPTLAAFRYDATNDPAVGTAMLAGYGSGAVQMSVYAWNGTGWNLVGTGGPDLGSEFRVAHDGTRLIAFGGIHYGSPNVLHGETWGFAAGQFTLLGGQQPQPLEDVTGCVDAAAGHTLLCGRRGTQFETWTFDGGQFALRAVEPGASAGLVAYDGARGVVVRHGIDGATREWNGTSWVTVVAPGAGPIRYGSALGFDGQRVLLFGGSQAGPYTNETWAYDGSGWTQLAPPQSPPVGLYQPRLVHDPRRHVTVLLASLHPLLYEWNGTTWIQTGVVPWTDQRSEQFVAYHPARGRLMVGGGQRTSYFPYYATSNVRDVWESDGAAFYPLANLADDHLRAGAVALPDGDLTVAGGWDGSYHLRGDFVAVRSVHPATVTPIGSGCPGSVGVAQLTVEPWQRAWLGDTAVLQAEPLPAAVPVVVWVLGARSDADAFGVLPRDLTAIGAPGCQQRVSLDVAWLGDGAGGVASTQVYVPPTPWLVGAPAFFQVLVPDAVNPAGFVVSDALALTVGAR